MLCLISLFISISVPAQLNSKLNSEIRNDTIEKLAEMLNDYVYPVQGKKMAAQLILNLKNGKYDAVDNFDQFAGIVTADLFKISNDNHLLITYNPEDVMEIRKWEALSGTEKEAEETRRKLIAGKDNFGFKEVKMFPGNIGYLKLNEFEISDYAKETAFAAMSFLSYADAVIIDLSNNNGGWTSLGHILCSYFFEFEDTKKNILLFETNIPYKNETIQYRVLPDLPGKRMIKTSLYILTSKNTYSAAERFAYTLQQLGRATLIGERTKGGANSTRGPEVLNDYYIVKMPVSRTINPVTKTNWEGVGVEPDIKTDGNNALDTTLQIILSKIIEKNTDEGFLNNLGYSLISENKIHLAVNVFKENLTKHPNSANCYDSLAEAYMLNGDNDSAIINYKKSLEINPGNENAKRMIEKLLIEQNKK